MKSSRRYRPAIAAALVILAAVVVAGGIWWLRGPEEEPSARVDGSWAVEYPDLGSLIASADLVVSGTVTGWDSDESAGRGSDAATSERTVRVEIKRIFHRSDRAPEPLETIAVADGWWEGDRGFEIRELPWLQEGQRAYFFLRYEPDEERYSAVGPESRALVSDEGLMPSGGGDLVWSEPANRDALISEAALQDRLEEVTSEVEEGLHEPVTFEVCEPSVPGDEASDPVCTTTW